jgi:hypothetical protein
MLYRYKMPCIYIVFAAPCRSIRALRAAHVGAFGGVDADLFAFVDEGRDLDDEAGFHLGGLGDRAGGGGLEAGFGFDDGELDEGGQLDADRVAVVVADLDLHVGGEVLDRVAEGFGLEHGLLEVNGVHEVVVVAVVVEELHVDFVDDNLLDGVGGAEALFEHGSGLEVAQLGLDEGAEVAGGAVLDFEDQVQLVFVFDDHAGTKMCGGNRHKSGSSLLGAPLGRMKSEGLAHFPL